MSYKFEGLSSCAANWSSAFCITYFYWETSKTLETLGSLSLIVWIIIEMVNYYPHSRVVRSSFVLVVEILMLLTLTCMFWYIEVNIAFSVYHTTYPLLYLELYFYNMYFAILCYYLIFNVFKRIKWMRGIIACFIGLLSLTYLLIVIDSFIQNIQTCKGIFIFYIQELSYLIMNSIGLFVSVIMFSAYRYNEIREKNRI